MSQDLRHARGCRRRRPMAPKAGATAPSPKTRPDFIGIRLHERHVFESKGRIRRPSQSSISKALGQVSALRSINSKPPDTTLRKLFHVEGRWHRGKSVGSSGKCSRNQCVAFDEHDALAKSYSFFLDRPTVSLFDQIGEEYVGREIEEGVFFGIDNRILAAITERPSTEFRPPTPRRRDLRNPCRSGSRL